MGTKRKPTYKQMAFETAVRNPERYIRIFKAIKDFENRILDDECLLEIISYLYLIREFDSDKIIFDETATIDDIKEDVKRVNSTRRADGGFPAGYASRVWTYMRTPSELGFVYAQYNKKLKFSDILKDLIAGKIDEQEAFSIQAFKYNRKSPYRNVSNDFNFFRFMLQILIKLKEKERLLSYEQFIVATFSQDGNVDEFMEIIDNNVFPNFEKAYDFVKEKYKVTTQYKTVVIEYPDVIRRLFIISGFISIKYSGKMLIQLNEKKLNYIKENLLIPFEITDEEKNDASKYFEKLNSNYVKEKEQIIEHRFEDKIDGVQYVNQISEIIKTHNITEEIIIESIEKIGSKSTVINEFKEIPNPLKLEFFISILIALKYGNSLAIRPNYKADHVGKPYSHAPGNNGDIEVFSKEIYWLIEVTLIRNKIQQVNNETTSVIRHFNSNEEFKDRIKKYLSFIAPIIHEDTRVFYDFSVINSRREGYKINIKPYTIDEFVTTTVNKENFVNMENYTKNVIDDFKSKMF